MSKTDRAKKTIVALFMDSRARLSYSTIAWHKHNRDEDEYSVYAFPDDGERGGPKTGLDKEECQF